MSRIIGSLSILAASALAIVLTLRAESAHRRQLRQCCDCLRLIRADVERLSATEEILRRLSAVAPTEFVNRLKETDDSLEERWNRAAETFSELDAAERSELRSVGSFLGTFGRETELDALDRSLDALENRLRLSESRSEQKRRTSAGLISAVGVLILITLM